MKKFAILLFCLLAGPTWGDVIYLKDGSRLDGDLKRTPDGWSITASDGKTTVIPRDSVKTVELGSSTSPGVRQPQSNGAESLASLRRSVEALSDINVIIDRYVRLVNSTNDEQVKAEAQQDLQLWQDRKAKGLVKYGARWVAPSEVAEIKLQATALAQKADEAIRQTHVADGDQLVQQALSIDPHNPAALYLRGVLLFRQDKIPDARKTFEAVNAEFPMHAPTLNNLAVILWKQNQQPAAFNYYDQAMQVAGANDFILANVAEALGTIPEDQRKGTALAKCLRRFVELDQLLQQTMKEKGLYRWGSRWVDQKQLDEMHAAEREVRQKLDALQADFDGVKTRIAEIDATITRNEQSIADLEVRSYFRDKDGQVYALPLPQIYYDLKQNNDQLRAEQGALNSKIPQMQEQASRIQKEIPIPRFTGLQQVVGPEGMPGLPQVPQAIIGVSGPTSAPAAVKPPSSAPSSTRLPPLPPVSPGF